MYDIHKMMNNYIVDKQGQQVSNLKLFWSAANYYDSLLIQIEINSPFHRLGLYVHVEYITFVLPHLNIKF